MKVNEIIREKRKELALTQEQVAAALGVSASAVHKWEKGNTYPDITLLPPLARLLRTDLNTLLSFREDLSHREITRFVDQVDEAVRAQGYEAAFQMALCKIQEYPTCEPLISSVILYLDGARFLYGVPQPERYQETFQDFYQRLSTSTCTEIRETAVSMLISYSRNEGNFDQAEELIRALPASSIDKEEQLAILYTKQERCGEAVSIWERRVLNAVTNAQTALMYLMEIAVKEERGDDADFYADRYERLSTLFDVSKWIPYNARLQLAVIRQDKESCLSALRGILSALKEPWQPQDSPLYRHLDGSDTNLLSERLAALFREELLHGGDFAFLQDSPEYQQLLREILGQDPPQ